MTIPKKFEHAKYLTIFCLERNSYYSIVVHIRPYPGPIWPCMHHAQHGASIKTGTAVRGASATIEESEVIAIVIGIAKT